MPDHELRRPDYVYRRPTSSVLSAGAQPEFAIKAVVDKQKPSVLVADDGSVCRRSAELFRQILGEALALTGVASGGGRRPRFAAAGRQVLAFGSQRA